MSTRTVAALFRSRGDADRALADLNNDLQLAGAQSRLHTSDPDDAESNSLTQPHPGGMIPASLRAMSIPHEDREAFAEGIRRGHVMLSAEVEEAHVERALDLLDRDGAIDLDEQEAEWRREGWSGQEALGPAAAAPARASGVASQTASPGMNAAATRFKEEVIPLVEEQISIGKRATERGRVRVRTYVVETPVDQQVTLRSEHVEINRRPVDRSTSAVDPQAFGERTVEVTEKAEEAVVGKSARVREEVVVRKEVGERVENIHDTVRRTEVEIDGPGSGRGPAAAPVKPNR
jgi:uncharacterized protein (TIGR02271 family)